VRPVSSRILRRADYLAGERYGIPVLLLMENAGRAVAEVAEQMLKSGRGRRIVVCCGGGNNGGDGIAAARTLHQRGYNVDVWLLKDPAEWKGSVALHYKMAKRCGVRFKLFSRISERARRQTSSRANLIIDALLGTGIEGTIRNEYQRAIEAINAAKRPVVSVDIPSGMNADTGEPLGACVRATRTVTMAAPKLAMTRPVAHHLIGRVIVADIGIPPALLGRS
jgi:hydroxyethylthiazole kinase-like uncharacterized protein yjeF